MGIKELHKFLKEKCGEDYIKLIELSLLEGERIGADLMADLHPLLIVGFDKIMDKESDINQEEALYNALGIMFSRLESLVGNGALPVTIVEGQASDLKSDEQKKRADKAEENAKLQLEAEDMLEGVNEELKEIDENELIDDKDKAFEKLKLENLKDEIIDSRLKAIKSSAKPSLKNIETVKDFIEACGLPWIRAKDMEAEKFGSQLTRQGFWALMTPDGDAYAHGCRRIIKGLIRDPKTVAARKAKGLPIYAHTHAQVVYLDEVLEKLELSYRSFVDMCILFGGDYCDRVAKFGPVAIYQIIKKYDNIDNIPDELDTSFILNKNGKKIPGMPKIFRKADLRCRPGKTYRNVRREFLEGNHKIDINKILPTETNIEIMYKLANLNPETVERYVRSHMKLLNRTRWVNNCVPYMELHPECYVIEHKKPEEEEENAD